MSATTKKKTTKRRAWMRDDIRELRSGARRGRAAWSIARTLRRTEGAVRQKAYQIGLSLRV